MISNDFPKISIITPVFNRADFLEETILSVINQNYPNIEYIIIDGGSKDGTIEIIKKYESSLSYWLSEPDDGIYFALEKGFKRATGEIMAWLNSDDKYFPGALNTVAQIFSDLENVEWISGLPTMLNHKGLCVKVTPGVRWSFSRIHSGDYRWIQQESVFWKRSLWEKTGSGLNVKYKMAADFDLWCRFFKYANLYSTTAPLSGFRLHGKQLSIIKIDEYEQEVMEILTALQSTTPPNKKVKRIRKIYRLRDMLKKFRVKPLMILVILLDHLIDKMHHYPPMIYFDFEDNKWRRFNGA